MRYPLLRLHDGYPHTTPELTATVRELQSLLRAYDHRMVPDGLFGTGTDDLVQHAQRRLSLRADGVVGPATWRALLRDRPDCAACVFPTGYDEDDPQILNDHQAALHYLHEIERVAESSGLEPSLVVALASKASRVGRALTPTGPSGTADFLPRTAPHPRRTTALPPDGKGFARGLMGLDYDRDRLAHAGMWWDPGLNLESGCARIVESRERLRHRTTLVGRPLLRAAIASVSAGTGPVLRAVRNGLDVDFFSAGRSYGHDVIERAGAFQRQGWD